VAVVRGRLGSIPSLFPSSYSSLIPCTEPDVLLFPISLLTVAALADAIQASLVHKYEYDARWMARRRQLRNGSALKHIVEGQSKLRAKRERRAEREAEGVVQDVQAALTISDVSLCDFVDYYFFLEWKT